MTLTELIHRRETEAAKLARARGCAVTWQGWPMVSADDRRVADCIVKAGLTLAPA